MFGEKFANAGKTLQSSVYMSELRRNRLPEPPDLRMQFRWELYLLCASAAAQMLAEEREVHVECVYLGVRRRIPGVGGVYTYEPDPAAWTKADS